MPMYKLKGHYPCLLNGLPSYVIIEIVHLTKDEANAELEKRKNTYTNLEVIEE